MAKGLGHARIGGAVAARRITTRGEADQPKPTMMPQNPRKAIDPAALRALTSRIPLQPVDAGAFMRIMREDERY